MRRATHVTGGDTRLLIVISIHALHEESDTGAIESIAIQGISIHALHEESDVEHATRLHTIRQFQSTLSMRRATCTFRHMGERVHFNPRSP